MTIDRRTMVGAMLGAPVPPTLAPAAAAAAGDPVARYRTPYKRGSLVLAPTGKAGDFDANLVDCPFVFRADDGFRMVYVGHDGTGYQTGMARSTDLVTWTDRRLILARDPASPVTRYNVAMNTILREPQLFSPGKLERVGGRYVGAWHAYPSPGYEEGPAVIGLAWSEDLVSWTRTEPILRPDPDAAWEAGGLYKPYLIRSDDTFYLFYNAKTREAPAWHEQTGVAMSRDLKTWVRHPGNPVIRNGPAGANDALFASDPCVFRDGKAWVVYYFGLPDGRGACELLALGDGPLALRKVPEVLIAPGPRGTIDDVHAHKASMMVERGDLYHFYCAVGGSGGPERRGISVARNRPWIGSRAG